MLAIVYVVSVIAAVAASPKADADSKALQARVDSRVELMSIIFRMAGSPEYNQPNSASPYAAEVEDHFGKFRDHPAVKEARRLHGLRGVNYDAVMSMALHIADTQELKERIPFDKKPPRLDERWRVAEARAFLDKARDFVRETKFNQFFNEHKRLYALAGQRLTARLAKRAYLDWFDSFFGARPRAKFHVIVGMLNGGDSYGVGVRFPDGSEEIAPVIGVWNFDDDGVPVFDDGVTPTIVHEFCHSYTNALVDKHADELAPAGKQIFSHCADTMKSQAYGNWKTMMYESLVRACVVRYMLASDGEAAAREEIHKQIQRGFKWTGKLSKLVGEYESRRDRYKNFDAFMPRVVEFFDRYAKQYEDALAQAPKVALMTPANGAAGVDPDLKKITIVFDRPMRGGCWSMVGGGPHFPEITGKLSYDKSRQVLTVPVRLKPDWSYQFWLNRGKFNNFQSEQGVRLEPVAVTFKTRAQ